MVPLSIINKPFHHITMDIVQTDQGTSIYILVVCDYAIRYLEAVALKSIDAEHVAEALITLFSRVGVAEKIFTDQGTNFTLQLLVELYRLLHVKAMRTSPYHPQKDRLVERFNQSLKNMLKKTVAEEGKDWDKLLLYLLFPQSTTGVLPFELMYDQAMRGPLDIF